MTNTVSLFIALYTDAHITLALVKALREQGYDAISAHEAGNSDLSDAEQLTYAAMHHRAILTFDKKDFVPLFKEWWEQGRTHYGIIVSAQVPISVLCCGVL
jgi:predicted nuclease of predicted toxin-antitoxin system